MSNILSLKNKTKQKYMGIKMLAEFKKQLLDMQQETNSMFPVEENDLTHTPDVLDIASTQEFLAMDFRRRERINSLNSKINKTLKRIEENEFGYCEECGSEIGLERLQARPTATLCISCKTIAEQIEGQFVKKRFA